MYVKVLQHWCGYKKNVLTLGIFFHLLKAQHSSAHQTHGKGFIYSRQCVRYFDAYSDSVRYFKDQYFLFTPLNEEAHAKICDIDVGPQYTCTNIFSKF